MAIPPPSPLSYLPPPPGSEERDVVAAPVAPSKKFPVVPVILGAAALLIVAVGVAVVMMKSFGDASVKLDAARPDYGVESKEAPGLVGTFYDFLRSPDGAPLGPEVFNGRMGDFMKGKLNSGEFAKLAQIAPKELVTARFSFAGRPVGTVAPLFDAKGETTRWVVHYRGKIRAPFSGKFRFVSGSSGAVAVRFNDATALAVTLNGPTADAPGEVLYSYLKSPNWPGVRISSGQWITVEKGSDYPVEIALMHNSLENARFFLMLQMADKDYPKNDKGELILESFRVLDEPAPEGEYPETTPGPVFPVVAD